MDETDEYLVKQCQQGNERAWASLVHRYKRLIYHFPSQARLSSEDCDEVFQDTLMAFYRQLDRIEKTTDLSHWLAKVAQRSTWKVVNRNLKYLELSEHYDVPDPDQIPAEDLQTKVLQFKIRSAMKALNQKCYELLNALFYKADESEYKSIADKLGIAVGSIGPTRNRCLAKFKKILAKWGIDEKNVSSWLD